MWIDPEKLTEVKEAITKEDIRSLIKDKIIRKKPKVGVSRGRARKKAVQKKKGRRKGAGSRKGKTTARLPRKKSWINRIRAQRKLLQSLKEKEKISTKNCHLYAPRGKRPKTGKDIGQLTEVIPQMVLGLNVRPLDLIKK